MIAIPIWLMVIFAVLSTIGVACIIMIVVAFVGFEIDKRADLKREIENAKKCPEKLEKE